jgi:cell division protein ZapA (FtsZ GTPase activity inhibitor)
MSDDGQTITVELFNKGYNIRCQADEVEALYGSVRELNDYFNKLDRLRNQHSRDQMLMLAALNFTTQLRQLRAEKTSINSDGSDRIQALREKIEEKLATDGPDVV